MTKLLLLCFLQYHFAVFADPFLGFPCDASSGLAAHPCGMKALIELPDGQEQPRPSFRLIGRPNVSSVDVASFTALRPMLYSEKLYKHIGIGAVLDEDERLLFLPAPTEFFANICRDIIFESSFQIGREAVDLHGLRLLRGKDRANCGKYDDKSKYSHGYFPFCPYDVKYRTGAGNLQVNVS